MISPKLQISVVQIILLFFILPFLRNPTTLTMARSVETLMEWILLKYEIPQQKSATGQQGSLQFEICACPTSSGNPSSSPQCRCEKTVVEGKPLHKAQFPSSCLTQPEATNKKCSVVRLRLTNPASGTFIYIRTRLGNLALTQPEFQQLSAGNGQMKSIARLSTGEGTKFISLAYSIQMPLSDSSFPSPPSLTVNSMKSAGVQLISKNHWKKRAEKRKKSTSVEKSGKHADQQKTVTIPSTTTTTSSSQQSSSSTSAVVAPPATALLCQLIPQMGLDANQIRQFLMRDAEQQRVHPLQFDVERFKRAVIRIHNRYRQMHSVDDLAHDGGCECSAKSWADSVARHAACLSHEPQQRYGESLFFYSTLLPLLSDPETLAEATVRTFYVEGRDYRRSAGRWDAVRHGHFTQMLWRQTQRIGVGVSIQQQPTGAGQCTPQGHNGQQAWLFYVVLRYEPPGNIRRWGENSFELNVPGAERTSNGLGCLIVE